MSNRFVDNSLDYIEINSSNSEDVKQEGAVGPTYEEIIAAEEEFGCLLGPIEGKYDFKSKEEKGNAQSGFHREAGHIGIDDHVGGSQHGTRVEKPKPKPRTSGGTVAQQNSGLNIMEPDSKDVKDSLKSWTKWSEDFIEKNINNYTFDELEALREDFQSRIGLLDEINFIKKYEYDIAKEVGDTDYYIKALYGENGIEGIISGNIVRTGKKKMLEFDVVAAAAWDSRFVKDNLTDRVKVKGVGPKLINELFKWGLSKGVDGVVGSPKDKAKGFYTLLAKGSSGTVEKGKAEWSLDKLGMASSVAGYEKGPATKSFSLSIKGSANSGFHRESGHIGIQDHRGGSQHGTQVDKPKPSGNTAVATAPQAPDARGTLFTGKIIPGDLNALIKLEKEWVAYRKKYGDLMTPEQRDELEKKIVMVGRAKLAAQEHNPSEYIRLATQNGKVQCMFYGKEFDYEGKRGFAFDYLATAPWNGHLALDPSKRVNGAGTVMFANIAELFLGSKCDYLIGEPIESAKSFYQIFNGGKPLDQLAIIDRIDAQRVWDLYKAKPAKSFVLSHFDELIELENEYGCDVCKDLDEPAVEQAWRAEAGVKGGTGSGFYAVAGHYGRPGYIGGSSHFKPMDLTTDEFEYKLLNSPKRDDLKTFLANKGIANYKIFMDKYIEEHKLEKDDPTYIRMQNSLRTIQSVQKNLDNQYINSYVLTVRSNRGIEGGLLLTSESRFADPSLSGAHIAGIWTAPWNQRGIDGRIKGMGSSLFYVLYDKLITRGYTSINAMTTSDNKYFFTAMNFRKGSSLNSGIAGNYTADLKRMRAYRRVYRAASGKKAAVSSWLSDLIKIEDKTDIQFFEDYDAMKSIGEKIGKPGSGFFGHFGIFGHQGGGTKERDLAHRARVKRAKRSHIPCTKETQDVADRCEKEAIDAIPGAVRIDVRKPWDGGIMGKNGKYLHLIEVKTFVRGSDSKIPYHRFSIERKQEWVNMYGTSKTKTHTIMVDARLSPNKYYYHSGVGGFRIMPSIEIQKSDLINIFK